MAASLDCCGHVTSRNWSQVSRRGNISRDIHGDTKYSSASKATSTAVKMNGNLSTNKIILVITIVIGCFAILWPTVFYPMLQAAFATQSTSKQVPYTDRTGARGSMHPAMMHPRIREEMSGEINSPREASPLFRSPLRARDRTVSHSTSDSSYLPTLAQPGMMGLLIPLYFMIVVLFLFYTMIIVIRKNDASTGVSKNNESTSKSVHDDDTSHQSTETPYYPHDIWTAQGKFNSHKVQSTCHRDDSSSNVSKCVHEAKKEICKLADAFSTVKIDQLIQGKSSSDRAHRTNQIDRPSHCTRGDENLMQYRVSRQDERSTYSHASLPSVDEEQATPSPHQIDDDCQFDARSSPVDDIDESCSTEQVTSSTSLTVVDAQDITRLRARLEQKEQIIVKLLQTINGLGSRLVDAGILPSLPGFFSNRDKNAQTLTSDDCVKSDQAETSKNLADTWIDRHLHSNSFNSEELEKQLAASTSFIASLGTTNGKRSSPTHRSMIVSRALRLLVQNMKLFGFFLIEVEDLRRQVNLLEARRLATVDTIDEITRSSLCSCMEQIQEEELVEDGIHEDESNIVTANQVITLEEFEDKEHSGGENCLRNDETDELNRLVPRYNESLQGSPSSLCQSLTGLSDESRCHVDSEKHLEINRITKRQEDKILMQLNESDRNEAVETTPVDEKVSTTRHRKARRRNRKKSNVRTLQNNHNHFE